jgi:hypothetical protein
MAKRFVCKACGKRCSRDVMHTCDQTCSYCMASPPCVHAGVRIPCADYNRHFQSQTCFANHKMKQGNKKCVRERNRVCRSCDEFINPSRKHECGKQFCETCKAIKERGHFCYMQPLKNVLPSSDRVLYVFYDFQTTQNTRHSDTPKLQVPNLVCIQHFCSRCDISDEVDQDCTQSGKRKHVFWEDPVDVLTYLCESRPWCSQIIVIAHNAKAFYLHFILNTAILLKLHPELIMSSQKILCMTILHLKFIDSICFMPFPVRKYPAPSVSQPRNPGIRITLMVWKT